MFRCQSPRTGSVAMTALAVMLSFSDPPRLAAQPRALTVSVAASLADVMTDLARRFEASGGTRVAINAAASNTLARQIVSGAPVDLFISADEAQMDVVDKAGRSVPGTRVPLVGNRLVVIVPVGSPLIITGARDLNTPAIKRLALGHPDAVPAGVYARRWLERLALWKAIEPKVVPLPTVRAALAAVREGRADAGIVYATDAQTEKGVHVAFQAAGHDVPAITYPAAVLAGPRQADAARFLAYLHSPDARAVFEAAGFGVVTH